MKGWEGECGLFSDQEVEESSSEEGAPSTELNVGREEPGREDRQCKGPEVWH